MKTKHKRDRLTKLFARISLVIMAFVLMISLCSAAMPSSSDVVLGLRRFKESVDTVGSLEFTEGTSLSEDLLNEYGFDIEPISSESSDGTEYVTKLSCAYNVLVNGDEPMVCTLAKIEKNGVTVITPIPIAWLLEQTFNVLSTANTTVDEWLLANSDPVINYTEPITTVFSGILDWLKGSLNTIQGLFVTYAGENTISPGTYTFKDSFDQNFPLIDLSSESIYSLNFSYDGVSYNGLFAGSFEVDTDGSIYVSSHIAFGVLGGDDSAITIYSLLVIDGVTDEIDNGYLVSTPVQIVVDEAQTISPLMREILSIATDYDTVNDPQASSYRLTFFGTLTVIGLSIALGFLIIGVIQRFLKLRG